MLPLPSSFNVYFLSSSGQDFSARVVFRRLFCFGLLTAGLLVCGTLLLLLWFCLLDPLGNGNTNIVTLGSVVSFLKSSFKTGTPFSGFKDFTVACARIVHSSLSALEPNLHEHSNPTICNGQMPLHDVEKPTAI